MQTVDVIVLGAGIVGASTALQLQRKGLEVALIDRRQPGEETSHGNAGIIERNGFVPVTFPDKPRLLLEIALKRSVAVNYDLKALARLLPWLQALRRQSSRVALQRFAHAIDALERHAVGEHRALAALADCERYYRRTGWIHLFRTEAAYAAAETARHYARIFGAAYQELGALDLNELEPGLTADDCLGVFWPETESVSNPGAVTKAFARKVGELGGHLYNGDARRLTRSKGGWAAMSDRGPVWGRAAVVALGPWAMDVLGPLGHRFPMAVKRGYHMHFRAVSGVSLTRPVVDMENGYVLTPMEKGVRLTTGVEFAARDAPPTPVQIDRAKACAKEIFPLGAPAEAEPWMGSRPCLPDSLPVVGASPIAPGLWLNFGHGHVGFTLGPVTGRLIAEMIAGQAPFVDPSALSPLRFL
ncbi:Putative D-amino-acid dehydrogenase (DadA-like) [Polymorphum gilvum SL003B-26A1]|uniref:Putative D-amino-acid dehydrogenase (DadA-like) n=1 Tax=Polymorphum gilvum (strain LMG 25793 / CGMCC 1.9160 / SL003B-26A1) TaxID=991905 RepID=F2J4X8_POLGS|nr:Putative D-amino-acid dehydrogenase (DadA-like) [Polymorphum gilvum SL003B-26A1]